MIKVNTPVDFDVKNPEHRQVFHTFIKENTWGKTKTRFVLEHPYVDIPTMIQNKLLDFYLTKEFNKEKA